MNSNPIQFKMSGPDEIQLVKALLPFTVMKEKTKHIVYDNVVVFILGTSIINKSCIFFKDYHIEVLDLSTEKRWCCFHFKT
jgi:hypothetical protein